MVDSNSNIRDVIIGQEAQREAAVELTRATRQLNGSIAQAARQLSERFAGFINPLKRFEDSINRLDQSNRAALRIGTTTQKLSDSVNKNSDLLNRGLVSNQKLLDAIVQNFESGIRVQNGALGDLTQEMIATGQDLNGLRQMNSDLLLFTGDNVKALQATNRANKEISDKYGVSNQKLIDSVNSLKETFEEASFFGGETTASLEILTKELKARTGGKNVEGAIRTLLGLGTGGLDTLTTSLRVGGGGLRARLSAGQGIGMRDIQPILDEVTRIAQQGGGGDLAIGADIAAMRTGLTRQQVIQLVNLNKQLKNSYTLNEEQKKTTDETYNSIQNINERARNFYDSTAIKSLALLGTISTGVISLGTGLSLALGGIRGVMPMTPGGVRGTALFGGYAAREALGKAGNFLKYRGLAGGLGMAAGLGLSQTVGQEKGVGGAAAGILGNALTGASLGGMFGGPAAIPAALVGGLLGAGYGIFEAIKKNTGESAEAEREQADLAKRKDREERAMAAARELERINVLTGYIRSRVDMPFGVEIMAELQKRNKLAEEQLKLSARKGVGAKPR
jgi:hypothetical protein